MTSTEAKRVGDEAFLQSDFDQAVAAYTVALAAAPLHDRHLRGTLLANRCLARLKLGSNVEAAVADAEEACEMRPRWGKAHLRKGQALEACRATNAAAHSYQRAVELDASLEPAAARALAALERHESRNRCLALLQGHQGAIYDAAVHPQVLLLGSLRTQLVATAGADATIRLWCSTTGRQLQAVGGHGDRVTGLSWSPCGFRLASASLDGTARLWQLDAAALRAPWDGGQPPCLLTQLVVCDGGEEDGRFSCLAFSPDGSLLATGSSGGQVRLWGVDGSGNCKSRLSGHGSLVSSVCFSQCGALLASASGDKVCKVYSADSGEDVADIAWDSGPVNSCRFVRFRSSAGVGQGITTLLLTCHVDQQRREGRLILWDVLEKRVGWVDGKLVGPAASVDTFRGKVTCADTACSSGGSNAAQSPVPDEGEGESLALLATACSDAHVRVLDLAVIAAVQPGDAQGAKAASAPLLEFVLADEGTAAAADPGMPGWHISSVAQAAHDRDLVALSPDATLLAAVGPDRRIVVVPADGSEGGQRLALAGHSGRVRVLRWLGCGRLLSAGEDGIGRVWQAGPTSSV